MMEELTDECGLGFYLLLQLLSDMFIPINGIFTKLLLKCAVCNAFDCYALTSQSKGGFVRNMQVSLCYFTNKFEILPFKF